MNQQSEIFARYRSLFNSKGNTQESETSKRVGNLSFVDFLFELVRATKGQQQFKNVILKGSLSKMKNVDSINKTIKQSLLSQFGCDNTLIIPPKYTTNSTTGIEVDKSQIDPYGILGINPDEKPGNLIYDGNDMSKANYVFYKAQGTKDTPLLYSNNGKTLFSLVSSSPNTYTFRFGEFYENKPYKLWLEDYLTATEPIFNFVNFTTILTDLITGAISIKADKNKIEIRKESSVTKACQKIFGFCTESASGSDGTDAPVSNFLKNQQYDNPKSTGDGVEPTTQGFGNDTATDDPFDFSFEDLEEIDRNADLRSRGVVRFATCGDLDLEIDPNDILDGLDAIFAESNNYEIYDYSEGNASTTNSTTTTSGSTYDNTKKEPNLDQTTNFFDNAIKNGATKALQEGESNIVIDLPNMNAELQLNILKAIPYALTQMVLSPKTLVIPKLYSTLTNQQDVNTTSNDLINSISTTIKNVGSSVTDLLIKNIYDSIKSDINKLTTTLATQFLKQRGMDYLGTLMSLISLLPSFKSSGSSGCGGVLNKLLKLLKLSNFGPMPAIPAPLILVGGLLKQGMNSVSIINDVKSSLTEKGIETSANYPDGTPNSSIIIMEETIKAMTSHIKNNSKIETYAIGATGPVQGYGQIQ